MSKDVGKSLVNVGAAGIGCGCLICILTPLAFVAFFLVLGIMGS